MSSENLSSLYELGERELLPESERVVAGRNGYEIAYLDEYGDLLPQIPFPDDTGGVIYLYLADVKGINAEIEGVLKSVVKFVLERYLPKSCEFPIRFINDFVGELSGGRSVEDAIDASLQIDPCVRVSWAKRLIEFFLLIEPELIDYDFATEILSLKDYSGTKNQYLTLFTLDEDFGPFTREELGVLQREASNSQLPLKNRVIMGLGLNYGVRPIQASLLKHTDIYVDDDTGIRYIKIPRVKQGAKHRRQQFTYRQLNDELALMIEALKEENRLLLDLPEEQMPLILRMWKVNERERSRLYSGAKFEFIHHVPSPLINYYVSALSRLLPNSPRTGRPFNLTLYRFRYTHGTTAVLNGMSEEEVAELLDHSSVLCVKHYFRYTREMWEMLENATQRRVEQQHFTAAWRKADDLDGNIYGRDVIELCAFTAIGKCQKENACYLEPAVACYSCNRFCPNKDERAHKNALQFLKERKDSVSEAAEPKIASQLDEAISGCFAAIAYSEGKEVISIYGQERFQ